VFAFNSGAKTIIIVHSKVKSPYQISKLGNTCLIFLEVHVNILKYVSICT